MRIKFRGFKVLIWTVLIVPIIVDCISLVSVPLSPIPKLNQISVKDFESKFYNEFQGYVSNRSVSDDLQKMRELLNDDTTDITLVELPNAEDPKTCLSCRAVSYTFLRYNETENSNTEKLADIAQNLCDFLSLGPTVTCEGLIQTALSTVDYILRNTTKLDANRICSIWYQQINCAEKDLSVEYPINYPTPQSPSKSKTASDQSALPPLVVVHLSDFHFDPYYEPNSTAHCMEWVCCRVDSTPAPNSNSQGAGYWGDYNPCDSPFHTIEDIVQRVKAEYKHIDIIYYTGDIVDHFSWRTSIEHNSESIRKMSRYLIAQFPNVPIYPVLGNHEAHPANSIAPEYATGENVSSQWLFDLISEEWGPLLPADARSTLKFGGHYSTIIRPNLRLVAINNNYCYSTNIWLLHSTDYFADQLHWFRNELARASENGEKVHVISHIPSNDIKCFRGFAREYRKIVEEFSDIIVAVFNGHTHEDEFNVYYSVSDPSKATGVAFNGGSGTTFAYYNSNFKVYSVDNESFEVLDYESWHYNLTEANLHPHTPPNWKKTYSFKEAYNLTDLSPATMDGLVQRLGRDRDLLMTYWERKEKYSDFILEKGCDDKCLKKNFCDIVTMVHGDNAKCEELYKL